MKIRPVVAAMVAVYVLNYFFYPTLSGWWSEVDVPLHFFGGFLSGLLGLACWTWLQTRFHVKNVPVWAVACWAVCFTALVAVSWELYEFGVDAWHQSRGITAIVQQPSVTDTMADMALGLIGAAVSTLTLFRRSTS